MLWPSALLGWSDPLLPNLLGRTDTAWSKESYYIVREIDFFDPGNLWFKKKRHWALLQRWRGKLGLDGSALSCVLGASPYEPRANSPGQAGVAGPLQAWMSVPSPSHGAPLSAGAGCSQVLILCCCPASPPQVEEQGPNAPQAVQPPSTAEKSAE